MPKVHHKIWLKSQLLTFHENVSLQIYTGSRTTNERKVGEDNKVRTCQFEGEPHKPQHNNNQRKKNYSVSKAETKTNRYSKSIV
jgi:hypothetical protein